ncbi:vitamin K epoxide reductase family protein [Candidatus Saccharibacteria bacterium]|nr:vitamin K epoxide reductase family protein [Candidatus Saccharibacteria bacterium]
MKNVKNKKPFMKRTLPEVIGVLLVVLGMVGFIASSDIAIEKFALMQDSNYKLSCDLSPLLSCGSVMITPQASAFGFPNPFIGIAGFAIVVTVGMALLAGAQFKRWFWLGLQAGTIFGVCFVTWLQYQSIFNIGALCPWCMVVWSVTIPIFLYTTLYNVRAKNIETSGGWSSVATFAQKNHANVLVFWYLAIFLTILIKFWYYWSTLI